jgi:Dolichyl-phosphate-mannose-protein mannosyltransferase
MLGGLAALLGIAVADHYQRLGLTLSHYDARGHLVVARRIFDSITPGWQQIGAVWLPLPHLLNSLPVQIDGFYTTGGSAVGLSILAFALAVGSIAWMVREATGSAGATAAGAAVFALNPNVLYLQSTPMTEPLLVALTTLGVALLMAHHIGRAGPVSAGVTLALACLTRYEAWPVTAAALAAAAWANWRRCGSSRLAWRAIVPIAVWPALAVSGFLIFSRIVVGAWFVSGGFFVPENAAEGRPGAAAFAVLSGTQVLSSGLLVSAGAAGLACLLVRAWWRPELLLPVSLVSAAALPWLAFLEGHPHRIRYMVPLIAAQAVGVGVLVSLARRFHPVAAIAIAAAVLLPLRPVATDAAMVVEAQWDRPNIERRRPITELLHAEYRGETVMASMGSLGHYMQDLSHQGFAIRDFLHEGNGDIWLEALNQPRAFAGWILIEETAEGGDMLARIARAHPEFLNGFKRVAEGGGLALYRRAPSDYDDR